MKTIQLLSMVVLVVAWGGIVRAANFIKPTSITAVSVQGEARYSIDGKEWHPLVAGKVLHQGAVIETAANSSVDLVLSGTPVHFERSLVAPGGGSMASTAPDPNIRGYIAYRPMAEQNVVRMDPDTMLAVDKLTVINTGADTVSDTELDLRAGGIFTNVKKMSASSQYLIKFPNGVAGIRGSCGYFKLVSFKMANSGATMIAPSVYMITGTAVISIAGPNGIPITLSIPAGFQYNTTTGQLSHLSPVLVAILQAFKSDAETIISQLVITAQDLTNTHTSPTQGTH